MEIQIQTMLEEHLSKIDLKQFDDFWNANILREDFLSPISFYIIAISNNEIMGFAGMTYVLDEAHISNIAVRKDKRNLGIRFKTSRSLD